MLPVVPEFVPTDVLAQIGVELRAYAHASSGVVAVACPAGRVVAEVPGRVPGSGGPEGSDTNEIFGSWLSGAQARELTVKLERVTACLRSAACASQVSAHPRLASGTTWAK